jgi:hypothetical protein
MMDRCLTDEEIAAYVDGTASKALRERVESHLNACRLCLRSVAEVKRLMQSHASHLPTVPGDVIARAEQVVIENAESAPRLDITAAITGGMLKILRTTGDLLTPRRLSAVPVRGPAGSGLCPRVAKSIAGYHITLELVPGPEAIQPVLIMVDEATGDRPDGVKVKMSSAGTSETKYTQHGKATFSPVGPGVATIDIEGVGRVDLETKVEPGR